MSHTVVAAVSSWSSCRFSLADEAAINVYVSELQAEGQPVAHEFELSEDGDQAYVVFETTNGPYLSWSWCLADGGVVALGFDGHAIDRSPDVRTMISKCRHIPLTLLGV